MEFYDFIGLIICMTIYFGYKVIRFIIRLSLAFYYSVEFWIEEQFEKRNQLIKNK